MLWLPAVGNLVAFAVHQWHLRTRRRTDFDETLAFSPQLVARITSVGAQALAGATDSRRCTLAIGNEGFTARTATPLAQLLAEGGLPRDLPLELLRPGFALPRLAAGTPFQLQVGNVAVADGMVVQHCA